MSLSSINIKSAPWTRYHSCSELGCGFKQQAQYRSAVFSAAEAPANLYIWRQETAYRSLFVCRYVRSVILADDAQNVATKSSCIVVV